MLKLRTDPPTQTKMSVAFFTLASLYLIHQHQQTRPGKQLQITPLLTIITIVDVFFLFAQPIPQPQSYHNFADKRIFMCSCHGNGSRYSSGLFLPSNDNERRVDGFVAIPNFGDVVSNLAILAGGLWGVIRTNIIKEEYYNGADFEDMDPTRQWQLTICLPILFYSTILISFGSTYYHWSPTDQSLVWDRLPMTLAFVSIFCFMLEEYTSIGVGIVLLFPLMGIGVFSIIYWRWSGDLRLYALVQFLPLLIIAWLVAAGDPTYGVRLWHVLALIFYALAKYCEDRDHEIYELTERIVSGHSMKHVLAGFASVAIASAIS